MEKDLIKGKEAIDWEHIGIGGETVPDGRKSAGR